MNYAIRRKSDGKVIGEYASRQKAVSRVAKLVSIRKSNDNDFEVFEISEVELKFNFWIDEGNLWIQKSRRGGVVKRSRKWNITTGEFHNVSDGGYANGPGGRAWGEKKFQQVSGEERGKIEAAFKYGRGNANWQYWRGASDFLKMVWRAGLLYQLGADNVPYLEACEAAGVQPSGYAYDTHQSGYRTRPYWWMD